MSTDANLPYVINMFVFLKHCNGAEGTLDSGDFSANTDTFVRQSPGTHPTLETNKQTFSHSNSSKTTRQKNPLQVTSDLQRVFPPGHSCCDLTSFSIL